MGKVFVKPADKEKRCIHCGKTFVFSLSEQEYYSEKNLHEPKRCRCCRKLNRQNDMYNISINPYYGWGNMAPRLYRQAFKGGFDVTGHTCRHRF